MNRPTLFVPITQDLVSDQEQALAEIHPCFNLEAPLLRKKSFGNGDSREMHDEKMYKLKILLESLANSTSKAEKRISDHRSQKEEALSFRVAKSNEVHQAEKEDELLKFIASCRAEAEVVDTWIKFLEDTWILQTTYAEQKEKQFLTTMSIVETMKKQFYVPTEGIVRKDDQKIREPFDGIEKLRDEFESIERSTVTTLLGGRHCS
ncbi:hypothetical protein L484_005736 [Morus notabilis]|uniref:Uncharacterized protein n=1 Tax=Morus notabilis TaxID=981085 RepID=W9QIT3_9ROSA|nr:hypothetical protein L484_005736 [Morus notabilis]